MGESVLVSSVDEQRGGQAITAVRPLPLQEQKELSAAILKRTAKFDYEEPSDEELTAAAARVFEVLDQEEDDAASR
jgi:hypothetical protein